MGKLSGILPIEGTVGRITFAKTEDGIIVREKGGVSAQRVATDIAFELTRMNNAEFGDAGKSAKLIFTALRSSIRAKADSRASSRLVRLLMFALKADVNSARGLRRVATGTPEMLQGFEFNRHAELSTVFSAPYTVTITRTSGDVVVTIPAFTPSQEVLPPDGATHFKVILVGAALNFTDYKQESELVSSAMLPLNSIATSSITLTAQLPAASTYPLMAALSISFYQDINGIQYLMRNTTANAMAIIKVDV